MDQPMPGRCTAGFGLCQAQMYLGLVFVFDCYLAGSWRIMCLNNRWNIFNTGILCDFPDRPKFRAIWCGYKYNIPTVKVFHSRSD